MSRAGEGGRGHGSRKRRRACIRVVTGAGHVPATVRLGQVGGWVGCEDEHATHGRIAYYSRDILVLN